MSNIQLPQNGAGAIVLTEEHTVDAEQKHVQVMHIGDRTDPTRQVTVSSAGALFTTFDSGDPTFDAFGRLVTATDNLLAAYKFYDGPKSISGRVQEDVSGGASIAYNAGIRGQTLQCGTADGDSAKLVTHRHFSYKPGSTLVAMFVVNASDAGKANVARHFGLGNHADTDGIQVAMDGTDMFVKVISSLGNGQSVNRTAWNGDRLDGTGGDHNRSGATLNQLALNIFWMTYQYLSAGAVTVGTYVGGEPVVCHTFYNYGTLFSPYMGTTDLAIVCHQENVGVVASTSEMNIFCAAVVSRGYPELIKTAISIPAIAVPLTDGTLTPIVSLRPTETYAGEDNRWRYIIENLSTITSAEPVELSLWLNADLTAPTWTESGLSLEWDTGASAVANGHNFGSLLFTPSANPSQDLNALFNDFTDGLYRNADITGTDVWTVCVKSLSGNATTVYFSAIASEVQ